MRELNQIDITLKVMKDMDVPLSRRPIVTVGHRPHQKQAWMGLAQPPNQIRMWLNGKSYGMEKEHNGPRAICLNHYEIRLYLTTHELAHLEGDREHAAVRQGKKALRRHRRNPVRFVAAFFWRIQG